MRLAPRRRGSFAFHRLGQSFYISVFRANYVTLAVILLVAALQMLPKRWNSPHFIVSWLHSLLASL